NDGLNVRSERFGYDSLGRLGSWNLTYGVVGGPATVAPATSYHYDLIGNLTQIWKGGSQVEQRDYNGQSAPGPHQLSRLTKLASGVVQSTTDYNYDSQGRMAKDSHRAIGYTSFD